MKQLPLFPTLPYPDVQTVTPLDRDSNCARCDLHKGTPAGKRCLAAEGEPGDILVVLDRPTEYELHVGRPAASPAGRWVRDAIARIAPGRKVVFAAGLGCKVPAGSEPKDLIAPIEACRPYLSAILRDADPVLVLIFGGPSGQSFLGRSFQPLSVRKGYGVYFREQDDFCGGTYQEALPAYLLGDPGYALRNRLIAKALEEDLRYALSAPRPDFLGLAATYEVVRTMEDAVEALECLQHAAFVATDCETSGMLHEPDFRVDCVAISDGDRTFVWDRDAIEDPDTASALGAVLEDLDHCTWNGQYDLVAMECDPAIKGLQTVPTRRRRWILNLQSDSRIKRKLFEADAHADLGTAAELIGLGGHKKEAHDLIEAISSELRKWSKSGLLTPTGRKRPAPVMTIVDPAEIPPVWADYLNQGFDAEKFAYRFLDRDVLLRYCARDAYTSHLLEQWCNDKLVENENLALVWDEVAQPAMWAWCRARLAGFPTDKRRVELLRDYLNVEIDKLGKKIEAIEPGLNPNAPQQVVAAFAKRGMTSKRTTTTGLAKMDKAIMEEFRGQHPLVDLVLDWKMFRHTQDNFAEGLLPYIRSDEKCHPSFLQDGSETGRPSSQDPNFFNRLKGRDEKSRVLGTMLRECHAAPDGWSIIEADQGQIEIRQVMDLCDDPTGIGVITSGTDFHMASARKFAEVLGKNPDLVSDIDREQAKTSNFAAIYELPDQLGFMLSKRIGISKSEGDKLATALFGSYKNLLPWMMQCLRDSTASGYSITDWKGREARHRPLWHLGLPEPSKSDRGKDVDKTRWQNHARSSWNGRVQGGAVDIITSQLWPVIQWLDANTNGGEFLLQIYDSIMLLVRDEEVDKTVTFLRQLMTDTIPGQPRVGYMKKVPLSVDVKVGKNWGALSKVPDPNKKPKP